MSSDTKLDNAPPDGGWGWAVVFGAFLSVGFSYAFPKALTVFYDDIQDYFLVTYSEIAWISSIMLATMYAGGPLSSVLVNRFGSRPVVIAGGLMCGVAMTTASFCTSIVQLYLCIGVMGGLGFALNINPSITIVGQYFRVKRPLANGITMAGSPALLAVLAPFNKFLFVHYGWRGSFLILGALLFNCCVAGSLMRPYRTPPLGGDVKEPGAAKGSPATHPANLSNGLSSKPAKGEGATKLLDFSVFRQRGFVIYVIGNMVLYFGIYSPILFLSSYAAVCCGGVDEYLAAFLLSILGIVDMFTRPITGLVANTRLVRPRIQYVLSATVTFTGLCHLMCPLACNYVQLVVYTVFSAVGFGMVFALVFECLMDIVGPHKFSSAMGLVTILECGPMLLGPPAAGALVDIYGEYSHLFYMCGAVMVVAGLFLFFANYCNDRSQEKETQGHILVSDGKVELGVNGTGNPPALDNEEASVELPRPETPEQTVAQKADATEGKPMPGEPSG